MWLGTKRAGLSYCSNEIGQDIHRLLDEAGIKPIRRNIMRYLHWFYKHSTEAEWMIRVDRAYMPYQPILSAKHLLPKQPTYDQMVLYSRLSRIIDSIMSDTNKVEPPIDVMGIRQALDKCLQDIPEEYDTTRRVIESLYAGLASCSRQPSTEPILKDFVPQMTKEELDEWAHKLKVDEPLVFKPHETEPTGFREGCIIAPEFHGNKLTGFSLCKPINVGNRVGDVIRGHRLTDRESEDSAYAESDKIYMFDEGVNKNEIN